MLKHFLTALLFVVCAVSLTAQTPAGVPKGAQETQPGVYRFVDKDKKVWIYRKTPFGLQKSAEPSAESGSDSQTASQDSQAAKPDPERTKTPFGESRPAEGGMPATKVTESGDSITFERPSPFGVYRWTRKKSELTDSERKLWDAQRPAQADKQ